MSISVPKERWAIVLVTREKALLFLPVEQWILVQFEKSRDSDLDYNRGQAVVPAVMGLKGLDYILDPIGHPGSRYLGYDRLLPEENVSIKENWEEKKEAYLRSKEPS